MIENEIFSVYDTKTEAYLEPIFLPTEAVAIRVFTDLVNDKNHNFGRHPEDYHLVKLGTWNQIEGSFETHAPKTIAVGTRCVSRKEETE